ncbi:MAG: hypothetical protein NT027_06640, partial [Proteobacteria bacterium]|nr:hypothetical protein [Pseudomonadota bacterium]
MNLRTAIITLCISTTTLLSNKSLALDVFTYQKALKKVDTLDDQAFAKRATVFVAKEPNFAAKPAAKYSGVTVQDIAKPLNISDDSIITFICKDGYLYADTLKSLKASDPMVANRMDDQPIPDKFGGPITLVHRKEVEMDRYPWYIQSIVLQDIKSPILYFLNKSKLEKIDWKSLKSRKDVVSKDMIFPSPRGRRLDHKDISNMKTNVAFIPLKALVKADSDGSLSTESFAIKNAQKNLTKVQLSSLSLAISRNGKEIPAYEGGPYIIFNEND